MENNTNTTWKLFSILLIFGFLGIAGIVYTNFVCNNPKFTSLFISVQVLVYSIFLILAALTGKYTYQDAGLSVPTINGILQQGPWKSTFWVQMRAALFGGLLTLFLLFTIHYILHASFPGLALRLDEEMPNSIAKSIFFVGFTEEIIFRFGLLSILVLGMHALTKHWEPINYWAAIVLSAITYGLVEYYSVMMVWDIHVPLFSILFFAEVFFPSLVFGYLYWRKGLESAMMAHMLSYGLLYVIEKMQWLPSYQEAMSNF